MMSVVKDGPRVTCPNCGETYVDDADWSGPAHGDRDCVRALKGKLEVERARADEHAAARAVWNRRFNDVLTELAPLRQIGDPLDDAPRLVRRLREDVTLQADALLRWREMTGCDTPHAGRELRQRAERAEAQLEMVAAERDVLRGTDCEVGGDGPCGVCVKCWHRKFAAVEARLEHVRTAAAAFRSAEPAVRAQMTGELQRAALAVLEDSSGT